ncbi:MAG: DUF4376 domain-containing protein [Burkholderiaceae bacterium]|nr:DUF4376 domain-containing protein [Burkholderiaceae bacterium]
MTAQVLKVFLFDSHGEYIGPYTAHESPLEPGVYIQPTSSTRIAPPVTGPNEVAIFSAGAWTVQPDYRRAELYATVDGSLKTVDSIGPLPVGVTDKPRPSKNHVWQGGDWAVDLAQLKASKNTEINAWRLKANRSTFTHAGKVFACDELSRSDIDGANGMIANLGAIPPGWPGGWKAVDNMVLPIATVADWKAFYGSMFASGNANFMRAQDLKTALAAATTAAQVAAIVW